MVVRVVREEIALISHHIAMEYIADSDNDDNVDNKVVDTEGDGVAMI